ncbi:MAG: hypothetical protein SPC78_06465, partial [Candidatus Faecousia sp.]|nr:hypothetical protein [Candidatus Faecousia sp.]
MRKFLSILMLACLLCGMVLPAGAEGEETAQLYAKLNDGTWVDGLAITQNIPASFCFSTEENGTLITDGITSSDPRLVISKTDTEGVFSLTGSTLTASERFSLTYSDGTDTYAITVAVTPLSVPPVTSLEIPSADLGVLEGTDADFLAYLTGKGYSGSGDFTTILPAEDLGDITCNVQLPGNATLTLKGASGKKVAGLTIEADNICVDGVTFEGADGATFAGMTVKSAENCVISNCTFKNKSSEYAFHLVQDERVPWLVLNNNTFQGGCNVELVDGSGTLIGAWQSTSYDKTKPVVIDFGATPDRSGSDGITVQFPGDMKALAQDGWKFKWIFITADGYDKAFVVYDGENIDSSTGVTNNKNKVSFEVANGGLYTVVKGTLPVLVKKDASTKTLTTSTAQEKYLNKVTVACDFKAVKITDSKGKSVKWEKSSDGKLTIWLTGSSPYTIKDDTNVTTKTTTKTTTTTKRSYNYKYQDYYLITPQRVTDCMRYAKDNLVTIECKEAGRRSISLPVASMAAAAEKGYSILLKNEKIADITIDAAALKSLAQQAKGTTVLLHYRSLNHKTLSTVGQASV